jgi:hypothetical protein
MAPKHNSPGALLMADSGDARKIGEGPQISAHYRSIRGSGGCGDQEIVSTTRTTLLADRGKKLGVFNSDPDVLGDDRQ